MKKFTLLKASVALVAVVGFQSLYAQQSLNVSVGNVIYNFNAETTGTMPFSNGGKTITINGNAYDLDKISNMFVGTEVLDANTVVVEFNGTSATVTVAGNIADYVSASFNGAHVTVDQSSDVDDSTGEITYILQGNSDNGSLVFNGKYKSTFELQGLTLTNPSGAAIDIENGKRVELSVKSGSLNTLVDGKDGKQKAALYCKGHLELKGKGILNITGNTGHAIAAKEYIEMKNCMINILGAPKDGINCTQYFLQESGTLQISGVEGDGIQVDFAESVASARDKEDTGSITIEEGYTSINTAGTAAKGLKAEGDFIATGGEIIIVVSGDGEWDSSKLKTKSTACIGVDGDATISGGKLELTASGGGGKGISCEGTFTLKGGNLSVTTSGGMLAYVNGNLNQNYTGNADHLDSDYKSSPKGIKADTEVILDAGTVYVKTIGNNGEGIESKGVLTINGGDITVRAKDDGINSDSHMYVKGGSIDVISTNNDGLDANGNIYIQGGTIMAFGGASPECGIDANEEKGFTVIITGGNLLAVGGSNSYPSSNSGSQQPYITVSNASIAGGNAITVSGNGINDGYTFTVPEDYTKPSGGNGGPWGGGGSNQSVMISLPGMVSGSSYTVQNGSASSTATARLTGSNSGGGPGGRP